MKLILKQSDRNQNRKQLTFSFHKRIYTTQIRRKLFQNSHDGLFQRIPLKILKKWSYWAESSPVRNMHLRRIIHWCEIRDEKKNKAGVLEELWLIYNSQQTTAN